MDWLYKHHTKVDFYVKAIEFLDKAVEGRVLQGRRKPASVRLTTTMQAKHSRRKGCHLFVVKILINRKVNNNVDEEESDILRKYLVLH